MNDSITTIGETRKLVDYTVTDRYGNDLTATVKALFESVEDGGHYDIEDDDLIYGAGSWRATTRDDIRPLLDAWAELEHTHSGALWNFEWYDGADGYFAVCVAEPGAKPSSMFLDADNGRFRLGTLVSWLDLTLTGKWEVTPGTPLTENQQLALREEGGPNFIARTTSVLGTPGTDSVEFYREEDLVAFTVVGYYSNTDPGTVVLGIETSSETGGRLQVNLNDSTIYSRNPETGR